MTDITAALQSHFGFSSFRAGQAESIQSLLSGRHTLAVMPTGAGKSLIFQLAALLLGSGTNPPPVTLVISPLIALMKDQVDSLARRGIPAAYINSALPAAEQNNRLRQLAGGKYRLVYIAPERLRSTAFLKALRSQTIGLLAVDEAHCISEWGHDFRPDYLNISHARAALGNPLTVALTATATPQVQNDILRLLGLGDASTRIVTGFNRANLSLNVRYTSGLPAKFRVLKELLSTPQQGATIIYTGTRRDAEEVAEFAREVIRVPVRYYHAGLPAEERTSVQEAFIGGNVDLVVATNAFGMGIDRADVRQVVHFSLPGSLEAYYQECGRAGRDGLPATAILLYDPQDRALHEFFVEQSELKPQDLTAIYAALPPGKEVWSTVDDISLRSGLHPVQIKVGLSALERAEALEHLGDEGMRMMYRRGSWVAGQIQAAILRSQQHAQNRQKELNSIVRYAESNDCRRRIILRHFGDPDTTQVADCCDNCRSALVVQNSGDVAQMNHGERAALIILDCIQRVKVKVGRGKLVQILHGSKAQDILKFHHDKNTYYGRLAALKQSDIDGLVGQLVDLGYIKAIGGEYPILALTPRGENAIQLKEPIPLKLPRSFKTANVQRAQARSDAGGTVEYTAKLFADGLKPEQIARGRALAVETIYGHFAQLIATGKVSLDQVVSADVREKIEGAAKKAGPGPYLSAIKALLPEEIDYNIIRCVLAGRSRPIPAPASQTGGPNGEIETFINRSHPRRLLGPWSEGWSLGFHSRIAGDDWSRSQAGELTYRLKYENDDTVLPALVNQALDLFKAQPALGQVDLLLPVPSSKEREVHPLPDGVGAGPVQRFSQALGVEMGLPVEALVEKTRVTRQQKEMKTLAQKRANVAGAFTLRGDARQKRILVIDDLYDSGATLEEITRLLLKHGAACVNVFTLTCTIHSDL